MAEPNATITNVLAVAIALTAIGTGGTGGNDQPGEQSGEGNLLSNSNPSAHHDEPLSSGTLYASALPAVGIIEHRFSQTHATTESEIRGPRRVSEPHPSVRSIVGD